MCMLIYAMRSILIITVAGAIAYRYAYFGRGNGSIYLSYVGCRGS